MDDTTGILEVGQATADTVMKILQRWGTHKGETMFCLEVCTNSGTVRVQSFDTMAIGPSSHNWAGDWIIFRGSRDDGKFTVKSIEGNPFRAAEIVEKLSMFLVSDDFEKKVQGCVSRMKKLHAALK